MQRALRASPASSDKSEEEGISASNGFTKEVEAATLQADISMVSVDLEEGLNEGTSITEKMGRLSLQNDKEEEKKVKKKNKKKPKAVANQIESGPSTRTRGRLAAFLALQVKD